MHDLAYAPWVIIRLEKEYYGIEAKHVREMVQIPDVTRVPRTPAHVRGVINLRGAILPLVDLRVRLGRRSATVELEELIENLVQREQDHRRWLEELQSSVIERRPFGGQLDPHKCAFGKWYDTFTTDNVFLSKILVNFDDPHKAIHAIGDKVKALEAEGEYEKALQIIEATRNTKLAVMIHLFEEARQTLRDYMREIAVVLTDGSRNAAICVDYAESVEALDPDSFDDMPLKDDAIDSDLLFGVARKKGSNSLIVLMNVDEFLKEKAVKT